ncbi:four-carbon acid sugar kinase family protein [Mesobacillus selenatarsenatis]|uniref:Four-carbon acid sugar kinase family protein n=1 Tax=Mesobacillus selenatarsenatis TaxID=388741 RepID=A0A846TF35_9BACI|nr:four-carbon acid sugar kinase family protein [Mesobacillus selenatarsenatis]NKE04784.1 four-carbon acid sugar kinase family protein [Mesobacillus selenatarsenatis]
MGEKIGIIADDLTGANDSGVQLAKRGFSSTVVFNLEGIKEAGSTPDVLVVDTDSRAVSGEKAHEAVVKAASLLFQHGYSHVYKKIDSTLRGNVAVEIAAAASVYKPEAVVIVPAFPKVNRTTVRGLHYVNGTLITETEFGRDPKTPVTEGFILDLLKKSVEEDIALIDLDLIRGSEDQLASFVEKTIDGGQSWFVCDSETEEDLKAIAAFFAKLGKKIVWAGSGGLIEYLPAELEIFPQSGQDMKKTAIDRTLTVSGSLSQVTKKQLESLKGIKEVEFIEINPVQLVEDTLETSSLAVNRKANHYVLYVDSSEANRVAAREAGDRLGYNSNQVSEAIAFGLAKAAKVFLEQVQDIGGLVLTGGDTAKAVCGELGVNEMELHSEVESGLPFGMIRSGEKNFWAITKAGGFGNEGSLVKAVEYMTGKVGQYETN